MTDPTCPRCGRTTDRRPGVVIAGSWHYCWLCECGERWGWRNEREAAMDTMVAEAQEYMNDGRKERDDPL